MAENAINNVPICDYVAEHKAWKGKYDFVSKDLHFVKTSNEQLVDKMLNKWGSNMSFAFGKYYNHFVDKMSEAEKEAYTEELNIYLENKKKIEILEQEFRFCKLACLWSARWAVKQEVKRFFVTISENDKLMKMKPHFKKFQQFMSENFPCLGILPNNNSWDFALPYNFTHWDFILNSKHYVYFGFGKEETFSEALEIANVYNFDFPTIETKEAVTRFLEAKKQYDDVMKATQNQVNTIHASLDFVGWSVFKADRSVNYQETIYF